MVDLSIVIPTCNRASFLKRNLAALAEVKCSIEIIVVDGASNDATPQVLARAGEIFGDRMKIIREENRQGFVKAANRGFSAATGRNMIWLNDDSIPLPGTLDEAVGQMDAAGPEIAFLAMFHRYAGERNCAAEVVHDGKTFRLCHVRGTLYANFPIGRRETFEKLGYFDERFYFYAADPDLSLKAWHAGLRVEPAHGCFIDHEEHPDDRRAEDTERGKLDNQKLFDKWNLPPKNPDRNDFDPHRPCTLRGLRNELPLVTFLISTFNRKSTLLHTLSQLRELEISREFRAETIVVDNASSDGTADAITNDFPNVRLIAGKTNRGACAKNAGLKIATGEFVVFLDDDSYPNQTSVERMIGHFRNDPRLGAAVFEILLPDGSRECSAYPSVCIGCGTGFRREALMAAGGLPEDFFMQAEEYDLSLRILDAGWDVKRFADLEVQHLKTPDARRSARTTRLDARNNLLVIARRFPRQWILPFALDWMRRYRWMTSGKDLQHRLAFWRGLAEGIVKSANFRKRREISTGAFEKFAMIREIHSQLAFLKRERGVRSILLIDVGKNLYPYWLAAKKLNLQIVGIADAHLGGRNRRYRGIPVIHDASARRLAFDAAVSANLSPVHAPLRMSMWRATEQRLAIDLLESRAKAA